MFSRLYETLKKIIRENYKSILTFLLCYFILMAPVPYYITTGGGTIDIRNRVQIKNSYQSLGSLHLAYVSELRGNVATYLFSFVMPEWERVDSSLYKVDEEESSDSVDFRNRLELQESIDSAILVAFQKAGAKVEIQKERIYVVYAAKKNRKALHVGDEILLVAGEKIEDVAGLRKIIDTYDVGDKISFQILREGEEKEVFAEVYQEDGVKIVGISALESYEYKTDPKVSLSFKKSESGPSGGMMLCLDIYNKLTKEDITKGYKIVGTGTVSRDGSVGEIGGVTYKLMGAEREKADIFLVPQGDNYKDAQRFAKKKHYRVKVIGVKNIEEALLKLRALPKKEGKK